MWQGVANHGTLLAYYESQLGTTRVPPFCLPSVSVDRERAPLGSLSLSRESHPVPQLTRYCRGTPRNESNACLSIRFLVVSRLGIIAPVHERNVLKPRRLRAPTSFWPFVTRIREPRFIFFPPSSLPLFTYALHFFPLLYYPRAQPRLRTTIALFLIGSGCWTNLSFWGECKERAFSNPSQFRLVCVRVSVG